MKPADPITSFYAAQAAEGSLTGHFNVYRREDFSSVAVSLPNDRRDFYKIWLITEGAGLLGYADKSIRIQAPSLIF